MTTAIRILGAAIAVGAIAVWAYGATRVYPKRSFADALGTALREQPLVLLLLICVLSIAAGLLFRAGSLHLLRPWLNPKWVWTNRRGEVILLTVTSCFGLMVLELGSRILYAAQYELPLAHSNEELIYPPLVTEFADDTDADFSVLMLGGSVLYGDEISDSVEAAFDGSCRVYNLAQYAHSSLDSLTKLRYVLERGDRFDYAIFYHGINEVRANNAPPELFADDYSHYFFYWLVHTVFSDDRPVVRQLLRSSLFYRAYVLSMRLRETELFGQRFVHIARPREDWLQHGSTIRSKDVFEGNLRKIIELCDANEIQLIVPRYAHHPILDDWAAGRDVGLDDAQMVKFAQEWGLPRNILDGMNAHNDVIAAWSERFQYVDTSSLLAYEKFVDPCHFTPEASEEFEQILIKALRKNES